MGLGHRSSRAALAACLAAALGAPAVLAQDATWSGPNSDWNAAGNWTPSTVPTGKALFTGANPTTIAFSQSSTSVDTIQFDAGAPGYNFYVGCSFAGTPGLNDCFSPSFTGQTVTLTGTGVVNNSANAQTFNIMTGGTLAIQNGTTANASFNMGVASEFSGPFGFVVFQNSSTAGTATFNWPDPSNPAQVIFQNNSSAGSANFSTANIGITDLFNGNIQFLDNSTAANATITNNFSSVSCGCGSTFGGGGVTQFGISLGVDTANAGNAHITNNSGAADSVSNPSASVFYAFSSAGNATIVNDGAFSFTGFTDAATAGNANITNTNGGTTQFISSGDNPPFPTAGTATIYNTNGGSTIFSDTSIEAFGFVDNSSADHATITNDNGGSTQFYSQSTAGNATITNNNGGSTIFGLSATCGCFPYVDTATAGNANITNNNGGMTQFYALTTAGDATITTNFGGAVQFYEFSTGGNARFITNAGGTFDMSSLLSGGMTAGSIEGAGTYYLGSQILTVGSNNLSTTVSGTINDGGIAGGTGGALVKVGTGSLTLSGANTYTGGTSLLGGTLTIGNDSALGTGDLSMAAGTTLSFLNTGNFNVANNINISGDPFFTPPAATMQTLSGVISDGGSPGTLEMSGLGTLALTGANTYSGGTTITSGTLQLGNGGTTGSIVGDVLNNGTLAFNRSDTVTFAGTISGSGVVRQIGSGATVLTADNNYTGGTMITGGTLQLGNGGTTGSIVGDVVNDGTLAFNRSNALNFAGRISGSGDVRQIGTGVTTLTAANTYSGATEITDGTLALSGGGSIANSAGVGVQKGTFDISQTNAGASINGLFGTPSGVTALGSQTLTIANGSLYFGVIQDGGIGGGTGGGIAITGGEQVLFNTNTYTGLTTINSGAQLTLSSFFGLNGSISNSGRIVDNGTFDISSLTNGGTSIRSLAGNGTVSLGANTLFLTAASDTFSGSIGGTGGLILNAGTQTLSGENTYTGGTAISGGTLQLGTGGTSGSIVGDVLNNGTFAFNRSDTVTFGGIIFGTGAVQQIGTGTTVLTAANTYTGGTSLLRGTLTIGNDGALGTGDLSMAAGTTLSFLNTGNFNVANNINISGDPFFTPPSATIQTLSGVISDGGSPGTLEMSGLGRLVLTGNNAYSGSTTVVSGTLEVDGSIASSTLTTVNNGATLTGTGFVGNTQINTGGTLLPGTSGMPGTSMFVSGNLNLQSGAIYNIFLNPLTNTITFVSGTASLRGLVFVDLQPGSYFTRVYDILHSAGLNGTTFDDVQTDHIPAGFRASLLYTSTDVFLQLIGNIQGSLNGNQQNVADALNAFFNNGGTLPPNFVTVFGLTGANLANALTLLDGEASADAERGAFQLMNEFLDAMLDPWVGDRVEDSSGAGATTAFAREKTASFPSEVALAYASALKAPVRSEVERRWSVWGAGYGGSSSAKGDAMSGSTDVSARTSGFAAGVDYRFSPDTVLGFALAGGGTNWGLAQGLGGGHSDAFQAGVYAKTRFGQAYVAGALGFAEHWMSTNRTAFGGDRLSSSFNAESYGARIESGYRYALGLTAGVTPYGALQAQYFHAPQYNETDLTGGGFALSYAAMNATDTRGELGARFDDLVRVGTMPLLLRGRLAWLHDWLSTPSVTATFQTLPGASFIVNGAPIAHDAALTSIGAELRLLPGLSLLGKFDGEFASRSQTYAGTGRLRYTW